MFCSRGRAKCPDGYLYLNTHPERAIRRATMGRAALSLRYISRLRDEWNTNLQICTAKLVCTSNS